MTEVSDIQRRAALAGSLRYAAEKLRDGLPPAQPNIDFSLTLERARRDPQVTPNAFRLLTAIEANSNKGGEITATLAKFASMAAMTAGGVSTCLDRLAAAGYINVRRNGPGRSVRVKLLSRPSPKSTERA